eukprot:2470740-Pleurochrysis_carterae.AAC.1
MDRVPALRQAALLRQLPNVQYINLQPGQKLTVVGDLHGQLADLLHIFRINGWPSATNLYLFNGDFVDRGEQSVEVVTVLFAWQQKLPKSVFLNRGNHEDSAINAAYGFLNECCTKYNRLVYKLFDSCFSWLPLATVVDHTTLVVHAGIDDHTSIADIAEARRGRLGATTRICTAAARQLHAMKRDLNAIKMRSRRTPCQRTGRAFFFNLELSLSSSAGLVWPAMCSRRPCASAGHVPPSSVTLDARYPN